MKANRTYYLHALLFVGLFILNNNIIAQNRISLEAEIMSLLQSEEVDSLQMALNKSQEHNLQTLKEKSLSTLAIFYLKKEDTAESLSYSLQLLNEVKRNPSREKLLPLNLFIGDIYFEEKIPTKALEYYHQAKALLGENAVGKNRLCEKLSKTYLLQGQVDSSLYFQKQLLSYYEKRSEKDEVINTRRQIVSILMQSEKYDEALEQNLILKTIISTTDNPKLLATINNNIGYNYNYLQNYEAALVAFNQAEKLNKRKDYLDKSILFTNIGIAYGNLGQLQKAINYLLKAKDEIKKNPEALSRLYHLIATIYFTNGDVYNALAYNVKAGRIAEEHNFADVKSESYHTSALIYQDFYEYEKALEYYQKHLNIRDSVLLNERILKQKMIQQQNLLERSEKESKLKLVNAEVKDLMINQLELEKEKLTLSADKLKLETSKKADELELLKKQQEIRTAELKNQELAAQQAKQELELAEQKLITQESDRLLSELEQKEKLAQVELEKNAALEKERTNEISLLTKDKELLTKDKELLTNKQQLDALQLKQEASFRNTAYGIGGLLGMMVLMFLGGLINSSRKNKLLGKQKSEIEIQKDELESNRDLIEQERSKSEALLLNILPKETAAELKEAGVAKPRKYKEVSILFSDFCNFTNLVQDLNPDELIKELNQYFLAFDEICEQYNVEKIKTIGDSFMCAGGIPVENNTHAKDTVLAALEMQSFVSSMNQKRRALQLPPWEMRIGIHTGPVIAGVVGSKKFAYDIWGDAVNTASRMETACEIGRINISATTYQLIKDQFNCTSRGAIEAKNKGEIEMYFVNGVG